MLTSTIHKAGSALIVAVALFGGLGALAQADPPVQQQPRARLEERKLQLEIDNLEIQKRKAEHEAPPWLTPFLAFVVGVAGTLATVWGARKARASAEELARQARISAEGQASQARASAEGQAWQARVSAEETARQSRVSAEEIARQSRVSAEEQARQTRHAAEDEARRMRGSALDQATHEERLKSYPLLVKATAPFALYFPGDGAGAVTVDQNVCCTVGREMSEWYFDKGGLLFTAQARDAYFKLARALTRASKSKSLRVPSFPDDAEKISREKIDGYKKDLRKERYDLNDTEAWTFAMEVAPDAGNHLKFADYVFLQSLTSDLRTKLTEDLRSRRPPNDDDDSGSKPPVPAT